MGKTADAIAEGVAIATSAARLAVKNRIIVDTIASDGAFAVERYVEVARGCLKDLAAESEAAAENVERMRRRARGRHSDPRGTHDYRDRDVRNLRRRRKHAVGVAARLRTMVTEIEVLEALVGEARLAAWGEVRSNLDRRLRVEGMRSDQDPHYAALRDERMQALREIDLAGLADRLALAPEPA